VERIVHSLVKQNIKIQPNNDRVWIVYVNDDMKKIATNIVAMLRLKGITTEIDLLGKPLKKQMEVASHSKYVVIVAPKEYANNSVIVRNMKDGSEKQVKLESILNDPNSSLQL
jgi:histidyl-tRNA synthetase